MLAKVPFTPSPEPLATPALPSFTVTFDPTPEPPASQFAFTNTADGSAASNYVVVDAGTTISITLAGATWSSVPVIWSIHPSDGVPIVVMSSDLQTISFQVPAPSHYFQPWVFRLSVDIQVDNQTVTGIRSPNIYLTRSQPPKSESIDFQLEYSPSNGNFFFLDSRSASSQAGVVLASQLVLINVMYPYNNFTVEVTTDDGSPIRFSNPTAIQWSTLTDPGWIKWEGNNPNVLFVSITSDAAGQSIGLQFQIEYNGITIPSPDPIIMNSTIGDG